MLQRYRRSGCPSTLCVAAAANFDVTETVRELEAEMREAANNLEFEKAARLRDRFEELKRQFGQTSGPAKALATSVASALSYRKGKKRQEDHRPERSDQALWLAYQHRAAAVGFAATLAAAGGRDHGGFSSVATLRPRPELERFNK